MALLTVPGDGVAKAVPASAPVSYLRGFHAANSATRLRCLGLAKVLRAEFTAKPLSDFYSPRRQRRGPFQPPWVRLAISLSCCRGWRKSSAEGTSRPAGSIGWRAKPPRPGGGGPLSRRTHLVSSPFTGSDVPPPVGAGGVTEAASICGRRFPRTRMSGRAAAPWGLAAEQCGERSFPDGANRGRKIF
jgi:hypothetical protein